MDLFPIVVLVLLGAIGVLLATNTILVSRSEKREKQKRIEQAKARAAENALRSAEEHREERRRLVESNRNFFKLSQHKDKNDTSSPSDQRPIDGK